MWNSKNPSQHIIPHPRSKEFLTAILMNVNPREVDLRGADLRNLDLRAGDLRSAQLQGADLSGSDLSNVRLNHANLTEANLTNACLIEADLEKATLDNANLSHANFRKADLTDANLNKTDFRAADLQEANLRWASLHEADLSKANLCDVNLHYGKLQSANLSRADLRNANLRKAILSNAKLYKANLGGADFSGAHVDGADFREAALVGTQFGNVNLGMTNGLETCKHNGPSSIDLLSLIQSGELPINFLRGCGLPEIMITYLPSLRNDVIQFYSCFISYSTKDQDFADRLHSDLQNAGVRCWFAPHDLSIGAKIWDAIDEAIRLRDKLLVILSEASVGSDWVEDEVTKAYAEERLRKTTVLFPIRIDESVMTTRKPWASKLRARHIGDFREWSIPQYQVNFQKLLRDLKKH